LKEITIPVQDIDPRILLGVNNAHIQLIKEMYPDARILSRGDELKIQAPEHQIQLIEAAINLILAEIADNGHISLSRVSELLEIEKGETTTEPKDSSTIVFGPNNLKVAARTEGQKEMVAAARVNDIVFCIGPAGTGKTYTAVALAVRALKEKLVRKIVLVRPAVEAGESLGFLPGDLKEKIDPYLRPLYDALDDMLPADKLSLYMEKNIIEIVPLAYMRGRTLNNAYIILDEAQNATEAQLKMLLTRMGIESRIIVTGDETQIDLPKNLRSGLIQAQKILKDIPGIAFIRLSATDVLRHRIIKKILAAYERADSEKA
jgi:phosphate starvation-inducible PhoH-like protein